MSRPSEPGDAAVQVVFVRSLDFCGDHLANPQRTPAGEVNRAIDLGGVRLRAALRNGRADFVNDDLLPCAYFALQPPSGNRLLPCHQRVPAFLLDFVRYGIAECIRRSARDWLVFEATETIDFGFLEPIEQIFEIGIGLAGKADDEGRS